MTRIIEVKAEPHWSFSGRQPTVLLGNIHQPIDPFPGYAHDRRTTILAVKAGEAGLRVGRSYLPTYYLLPYDTPEQTNGWQTFDYDYSRKVRGEYPRRTVIVFAGKRIPPHPAMTRYLAGHEYGHVVQYWIEHARGLPDGTSALDDEYAAIRRLKPPTHYGGGTWHVSIGEVFANDYRVLLAGVETEFWPNRGVTRPEYLPRVKRWWDKALKDYGQ